MMLDATTLLHVRLVTLRLRADVLRIVRLQTANNNQNTSTSPPYISSKSVLDRLLLHDNAKLVPVILINVSGRHRARFRVVDERVHEQRQRAVENVHRQRQGVRVVNGHFAVIAGLRGGPFEILRARARAGASNGGAIFGLILHERL